MSARAVPAGVISDVECAWQRAGGRKRPVKLIETLQDERRRSVYRVTLGGPGPSTMIAKRAPMEEVVREVRVYTDVLPRLPMPTLRMYGHTLPADQGDAWLFIEEAVGEAYDRSVDRHREVAGTWLGRFHAAVVDDPRSGRSLRKRGADYFVEHLRASIVGISAQVDRSDARGESTVLLAAMGEHLCRLQGAWPALATRTSTFPATYVHGDYKPENLRLRHGWQGPELLAFDWNEAGYGPPALDLTRFLSDEEDTPRAYGRTWVPALHELAPDLDAYLDAVRPAWPEAEPSAIRWLGLVGEVFVCITSIRWEVEKLAWEESGWMSQRLRWYDDWLAQLLQELEA